MPIMPRTTKAEPQEPEEEEREMVKAQYVLERRQIHALRGEAVRRAGERHSSRLDASEVLREIIDGWIARGGKR